jgi:hypothetical protein
MGDINTEKSFYTEQLQTYKAIAAKNENVQDSTSTITKGTISQGASSFQVAPRVIRADYYLDSVYNLHNF